MVRQITAKRTPGWKAILAIAVAAGALLWHMLACTESPMAFSPEGDLAFVTMEPYDFEGKDLPIAGAHAYRLMVLSKGKDLRVIEQTSSHLLSAPAYSPDGKHITYLRIPLLSKEAAEQVGKTTETRMRAFEEFFRARPDDLLRSARTSMSEKQPTNLFDSAKYTASIPNLLEVWKEFSVELVFPTAPVTLVGRDTKTDEIVYTENLDLPIFRGQKEEPDYHYGYLGTYRLTQPQVSPDGKFTVFCAGGRLVAMGLSDRDQAILAVAKVVKISPDGKFLAALAPGAIAFLQADGEVAVYKGYDTDQISASGFAWVDNETLVVLTRPEVHEGKTIIQLCYLKRDGTEVGSKQIELLEKSLDAQREQTGELTLSPDGQYMALSYGQDVLFLDNEGKIIKHLSLTRQMLVQPTFTADSKQVAFKHMTEEEGDYLRVASIVFFTPEGVEVSRVEIPRIEPGTLQTVPQPSPEPESK